MVWRSLCNFQFSKGCQEKCSNAEKCSSAEILLIAFDAFDFCDAQSSVGGVMLSLAFLFVPPTSPAPSFCQRDPVTDRRSCFAVASRTKAENEDEMNCCSSFDKSKMFDTQIE